MAYKAYLNNNIFFSTASPVTELSLTAARVKKTLGTAGEFAFTLPPVNTVYGSIRKLVDFVDVYRDDALIFSGRVYSIEEAFDTQLKVVCEGLLALLNDSVFRPVTFQGELHSLVRQILQSHNEQVETAKQIQAGRLIISNSECYRAYQNYETSISRLQDLVQSYGGWIRIRRENGVNYLDWYEANIDGTSQRIDFGENLLDIKQSENADGICTVLIPLGAANDDNERVDITSVNGGLDYIQADDEYIQKYGYIVASHIWDDVNYPNILLTKARQYINACLTPRKTINLTAVDLADAGYDVDTFALGQKIKVTSKPHGIEGEWFDCNTLDRDIINTENTKLSLGTQQIGYIKAARSQAAEVKSAIERITATYAPQTMLQASIERATNLITGNSGGYIILHDSNGDGEPDELLVMDTPDIDTAVKVWRFNNSGLGYSSTGYNGTFGLAMTMDGQIVADFITTGTMSADRIKTGRIQSPSGGSWWDLDTGELHIQGDSDVDKSKVFIQQPTTPYYIGDLWVTGYNKHTAIPDEAIPDYALPNEVGANEESLGVIYVCERTRTDGDFDADDWRILTDYIDASEISELSTKINAALLEISSINGQISMMATSTELSAVKSQITTAQELIDGQQGQIDLLATQVTTVADKSKTFRTEPVPPYEDGDTWITGKESYTAIPDEAIPDKAIPDWGGDIFVCIQTKAADEEFSMEDWILATKYVDESSLDSVKRGLRQEIRQAEIAIDAANARIDLKANATTVTALTERVRNAEISLDGANAKIALKAEDSTVTALSQRVKTAEINIDALNTQIDLSTSSTTTIAGRLKAAEASLKLKVDNNDFTAATIAAKLNSGSSTINEAKIGLTAATIVSKINGGSSKINSTKVDISATTIVDLINGGSSTINEAKVNLTAATIASKINGGSSKINEAKISLTATNIAGLINESSVSISADRINLKGQLTIEAFNSATQKKLISSTVSVYYRSTSQSTPSISTSTSIGTSATTSNAWEYVMPQPKKGCYFYTCERYVKADGSVAFSTVRELSEATYASKWVHTTDITCIDGANIYTGSLTADSIKAGETFTQELTAENLNITGGTVTITSPKLDWSYINIAFKGNSTISSWFGSRYCGFKAAAGSVQFNTWWGGELTKDGKYLSNQYITFQNITGSYTNQSWLSAAGLSISMESDKYLAYIQDGALLMYFYNNASEAKMSAYASDRSSYVQADWIVWNTGTSSSSDRRLKKQIKTLDPELAAQIVYALSPVEYLYNSEVDGTPLHHGLIAQDVESTIGGMSWGIVREHDGYKTLNYIEIIADLIATVQTLNLRLKALERRVNGS